jgi:hypothetical protein
MGCRSSMSAPILASGRDWSMGDVGKRSEPQRAPTMAVSQRSAGVGVLKSVKHNREVDGPGPPNASKQARPAALSCLA